jgi:WD40 repeat protein/mono/diheme cytochrome c family protein
MKTNLFFLTALVALLFASPVLPGAGVKKKAFVVPPSGGTAKVSYYNQVRPIFVANCQGCHQPSNPSANYIMTEFKSLLAGGRSNKPAIVPHHPEKSHLVAQITPDEKGAAKMPMARPPLPKEEIELIKRWIAQGAVDDSAQFAKARFDMEHPPVYTRPPVITSLDFSPDGKLLALAGFNEVLLVNTSDWQLSARLVGKSERIQAVKFSPDGKSLAVAAGQPARSGEVQVWDVAARQQTLSMPVTNDTVYGVSWSPDGKFIAFGCADNTVRAIDAKTGEQVLFMGSHNGWVLGTVFSVDGSHLVSVGGDMTAKLTEVATQRFVDNITSITPGALKGGIQAVARHPQRDEIVIGGADSVPKVYRIHRLVERRIGDDSNLIRQFPAMKGRIFSVAVSHDGKRIAAASSLDGKGEVDIFSYEFDTSLPENIKKIMAKVSTDRSREEVATLEKYHTDGATRIAKTEIPESGIYAVAFAPDGKTVAAAGADGNVRLIDATDGKIVKAFVPVPIQRVEGSGLRVQRSAGASQPSALKRPLPKGVKVASLDVHPKAIQLTNKFDYAQLVVTAKLASGDSVDATRLVKVAPSVKVVDISQSGFVSPLADGKATLRLALSGKSVAVPVTVKGTKADYKVDFIHDVAPVLSRLGCNAGTCHGAAKGKNGFKLSLRGYDPIEDVRALTDDLWQRRVNVASPDDSLILLKATGAVPHVGGQLFRKGEPYYEIIRNWIANGAQLDRSTPRVTKVEILPKNPMVQRVGEQQQMRVLATYADGKVRDVTREAFIESGNTEVATVQRPGLMTAVRRGEAPVLVRFEGAYTATTLTVMGDRTGFVWRQPPANNRIDELVAAKWKRMKIQPSELCSDAEFIRRVYLDLTGLPPSADDVRKFLEDKRDTKVKRDELVDKLVGSKEYVEHWANKWADLLQVNRKFLDVEGAANFRKWIRGEVANNTPYNEFARKILTATGSNRENPAASYFKIQREPSQMMETTTHLFLGVRFNCNKCHDHPFERWTQDQYYQMTAFFAQTELKEDPESKGRRIGGTAVEGSKPLYEIVVDKNEGETIHLRTGAVAPPTFPFPADYKIPSRDVPSRDGNGADNKAMTRREKLAAWLTSPNNPYFARSYVNRLWGYLFGVGIIEPIDDIRAGNPPTNPELLDYLTKEFISSGFNAQHVIKLICKSRTYQLSVVTNKWNADDKINYSHAIARRLPAEVLLDAVYAVTGSLSNFPGLPRGIRAAELPDNGIELPSGFLSTFGRPARESACECERQSGLQLGPVMALVSGPTVAEAIGDPQNEIAKLVAREPDDAKVINEIFLRILNRPATEKEIKATMEAMNKIEDDHRKLTEALKKREAEVAQLRPKQEKEREEAIAKAKEELAAYEKELAPILAQREKEKAERTAKLEAELQKYEAERLPVKAAELAKNNKVAWIALDAKSLKASSGAELKKEADLSIVASGALEKTTYTVVVETDLKNITGIRLEAIADPRFKNNGAGRAPDGNFVLTEFEVKAAPKSNPEQAQKVALQNALADFSQENYPVKNLIDNDLTGGNGWAVSPAIGVTHWATLETKEPIGFDGGTVLTFILHHNFNNKEFSLGRFRISVTTAERPLGLSLSDELTKALSVASSRERGQAEETLRQYFRRVDADWRKKVQEVADSKKPLPIDPKLKELKENLEYVSRPIPMDPLLAQLRADVEASTKQVANKRLTAMQDLAWALINSPAFLFNH